jgi:hypothetical protein
MAQFQKGEGGRLKGTPNRITAELRDWISFFIHDNKEKIQEDFNSLNPRDRVVLFPNRKTASYLQFVTEM